MQKVLLKITIIICLLAFPLFSGEWAPVASTGNEEIIFDSESCVYWYWQGNNSTPIIRIVPHESESEEQILDSNKTKRRPLVYYDDLATGFTGCSPRKKVHQGGNDYKNKFEVSEKFNQNNFLGVELSPMSLSSSLDEESFSEILKSSAKRAKSLRKSNQNKFLGLDTSSMSMSSSFEEGCSDFLKLHAKPVKYSDNVEANSFFAVYDYSGLPVYDDSLCGLVKASSINKESPAKINNNFCTETNASLPISSDSSFDTNFIAPAKQLSDFEIPKDLKHMAIIFDGSRRWAKEKKLPQSAGHKVFIGLIPEIATNVFNLNIHSLTLWCFSTGNWVREEEEVNNLMNYFEELFDELLFLAPKLNMQVVHIGRKDRIPLSLLDKIVKCEEATVNFHDHILNIAIDYGGNNDIARAIKKLAVAGKDLKGMSEESIEELITENVDTALQPYPNPDLIIRTSPIDNRLSGFMTWQSKYSELYLTGSYAPDFNMETLTAAILEYKKRRRMFSK